MLKKVISYLVIVSMLWMDIAWAVIDLWESGSSEEEFLSSSPSLSLKKKSKESKKDVHPSHLPASTSPLHPDHSSSSSQVPSSSHTAQDLSFQSLFEEDSSDDQKPLLNEEDTFGSSLSQKNAASNQEDNSLPSLRNSFVQLFSDDESKPQDLSLKSFDDLLKQEHPDLENTLEIFQRIEKRPFFVKWVYLDHMLEKLSYALWLRKKDVTGVPPQGILNSPPLWIEGRGVLLRSAYPVARGITGFRQGVEYAINQSLFYIFQGLIGYQFYEQLAHTQNFNLVPILRIAIDGDKKNIRGLLSLLVQHPQHTPYFLSLFAVPVLWGLAKSFFFAKRAVYDTEENFRDAVKVVEDFSLPKKRTGIKGFWKDKLRWIFPLYDIDGEINYLVYRLLLDGSLSLEERSLSLNALINLTQNTTGFSRIAGLNAMQKLAVGTSLNQMNLVGDSFGEAYKKTLLREKVQALDVLRKGNIGVRKAGVRGFIYNLYAHYLRWEMGDFDSNPTSAIAWGVYKATTVGLTINFFVQVALQIIDYLKCPKQLQRGFSYAMNPTGYSRYNQECFDAYLSVFNKVPGQPACTLISIFPKFKLHHSYTLFNLSGAGATGEQVAALIMGLRESHPHIHLTQFDLSNNAINTASGMTALFNAFKNITATAPPHKGINFLDLSRNQIGFSQDLSTQILGAGLQDLPQLQTLDLALNYIGSKGDNGTVGIGQGLRFLTNLKTLDLSDNQIGVKGDNGTVAIGEGLKYLPQLRTLNLSQNRIGSTEANGTVAIGEGLQYLPHLQTLDLSNNEIGYYEDNGTVAIGEGLKYLTQLRTLDLSQNQIGYTGDKGGIAIGEGLQYLTQLQTLDLSHNVIGSQGDNGTIAIGKGLKYLPHLQTLDFSQNFIGSGFSNFVNSIVSLKTLESLFVQQFYGRPIPSSQLNLLKQFWSHRNPQTDVYALITLEDVQTYLNSLPNTTKTINLSQNFPDPSADVVTFFFKGMRTFHELQTLDLSHNGIGSQGENGTVAIGEGLQYLTQLQTLDLSHNVIGSQGDNGTIAIGEGLKYLPHLQILNLSDNWIGLRGDQGTIAIGEGLKYLPRLQILNLSDNWIGSTEANGTVAIGEGLEYLTQLRTLNLSQNRIGSIEANGTVAIGEGLKYLTQLRTLDLSQNQIGWHGDNGTIALGKRLHYLPQLQTLNLSKNRIGSTDDGMVAIGEGLQYLSQLRTLDLSQNYIGGFGAQSLFKDLPQLICHGLQTLDLSNNNFTGIPWSQPANALEGLYSAQIQKSCEAHQCFGTPIDVNTIATQCQAAQKQDNGLISDICSPLSSSASSLAPPYLFKVASDNRELLGSVALLFVIGHQLSPLASKAIGIVSSWFKEESIETTSKSRVSSSTQSASWTYFRESVLFFVWLFLLCSFVSKV